MISDILPNFINFAPLRWAFGYALVLFESIYGTKLYYILQDGHCRFVMKFWFSNLLKEPNFILYYKQGRRQ